MKKIKRERLIEERKNLNLTQEQLASNLGISTIYVRKLENMDAKPGRETMIKFESFFKISSKMLFPDLFFENDDKKFIETNTA